MSAESLLDNTGKQERNDDHCNNDDQIITHRDTTTNKHTHEQTHPLKGVHLNSIALELKALGCGG